MEKCCLFKDAGGSVSGYLLRKDGAVLCHADGCGSAAKLMILISGQRTEAFELVPGVKEQTFCCADKELLGAAVVQDGSVLMSTDDASRTAISMMMNREKKERQRTEERKQEKTAESPLERKKQETMQADDQTVVDETEDGKHRAGSAWPQSRWPAPVCMSNTVYCEGCWQEWEDIVFKEAMEKEN